MLGTTSTKSSSGFSFPAVFSATTSGTTAGSGAGGKTRSSAALAAAASFVSGFLTAFASGSFGAFAALLPAAGVLPFHLLVMEDAKGALVHVTQRELSGRPGIDVLIRNPLTQFFRALEMAGATRVVSSCRW